MELNKQRMMKLAGLLTESINESFIPQVNFGKDPKKFAKGYDGDDMMWQNSTSFDKKTAIDIMKKALPNGYNEFKAESLDKLPPDSKIKIGREYSVCIYVSTKTKISRVVAYDKMDASEIDEIDPGYYRIWWD